MFVTQTAPKARISTASFEEMKANIWDHEASVRFGGPGPARGRRKSVARILRDAYRKHVRDEYTRQAVKRWLR